jgi:DNA repair protein RadC
MRKERHNPYQLPFIYPEPSFLSEPHGRHIKRIETPFQIRSPADAAQYMMSSIYFPFEECVQEELYSLLLDTRNYAHYEVRNLVGSLNTTVVRIGELFREPIKNSAAGLIIAHNHPSGDPTPSPEDVRVTEMLVEAGQLLNISLLDHLVIGRGRYVSLKERGLGFK